MRRWPGRALLRRSLWAKIVLPVAGVIAVSAAGSLWWGRHVVNDLLGERVHHENARIFSELDARSADGHALTEIAAASLFVAGIRQVSVFERAGRSGDDPVEIAGSEAPAGRDAGIDATVTALFSQPVGATMVASASGASRAGWIDSYRRLPATLGVPPRVALVRIDGRTLRSELAAFGRRQSLALLASLALCFAVVLAVVRRFVVDPVQRLTRAFPATPTDEADGDELARLRRQLADGFRLREQAADDQARAAERSTLLARIAREALAEHDPVVLFDDAIAEIGDLLKVARIAVVRTGESGTETVVCRGWSPGDVPPHANPLVASEPIGIGGGTWGWLVVGRAAADLDRADRRFLASAADLLATVAETRRLSRELERQAMHDPLTGLPNRLHLLDRLKLAASYRDAALLLVDLDDFKAINDTIGHAAGDRALVAVADRLRSVIRGDDSLARLGGDEFALVLTGLDEPTDADRVAARIVATLSEPIDLGDTSAVIGASVGIVFTAADSGPADLLRDADLAMYEAKRQGRNRWVRFRPDLLKEARDRVELRAAIDDALAGGEFSVHYQQKFDVATGALLGFEALVRWRHAERGWIPPAEFIPAAEQTGQIVALGRFVLDQALGRLVAWQDVERHGEPLLMAVNVSPRQLEDPTFLGDVAYMLQRSGVDPDTVICELTESYLISDITRTAAALRELKRLGVRIAIDDYGSGNASIAYLREMPADILKIDRSLVSGLGGDDPQAVAIIRSIIELAGNLGLTTVAEGVEHAHQLDRLRELGCQAVQGYHLARPVPADEIDAVLRSADSDYSPSA